jgi:hypothetical protein
MLLVKSQWLSLKVCLNCGEGHLSRATETAALSQGFVRIRLIDAES